ncbi:MAG: hypothetical protein CMH55_04260 [Myxococcales bacterium]|nr:hypothetical protein [Myxococcales bacterium]
MVVHRISSLIVATTPNDQGALVTPTKTSPASQVPNIMAPFKWDRLGAIDLGSLRSQRRKIIEKDRHGPTDGDKPFK